MDNSTDHPQGSSNDNQETFHINVASLGKQLLAAVKAVDVAKILEIRDVASDPEAVAAYRNERGETCLHLMVSSTSTRTPAILPMLKILLAPPFTADPNIIANCIDDPYSDLYRNSVANLLALKAIDEWLGACVLLLHLLVAPKALDPNLIDHHGTPLVFLSGNNGSTHPLFLAILLAAGADYRRILNVENGTKYSSPKAKRCRALIEAGWPPPEGSTVWANSPEDFESMQQNCENNIINLVIHGGIGADKADPWPPGLIPYQPRRLLEHLETRFLATYDKTRRGAADMFDELLKVGFFAATPVDELHALQEHFKKMVENGVAQARDIISEFSMLESHPSNPRELSESRRAVFLHAREVFRAGGADALLDFSDLFASLDVPWDVWRLRVAPLGSCSQPEDTIKLSIPPSLRSNGEIKLPSFSITPQDAQSLWELDPKLDRGQYVLVNGAVHCICLGTEDRWAQTEAWDRVVALISKTLQDHGHGDLRPCSKCAYSSVIFLTETERDIISKYTECPGSLTQDG